MRIGVHILLSVCLWNVLIAQVRIPPPFTVIQRRLGDLAGVDVSGSPGKCGTPLIFEVNRRWMEFPQQVRSEIGELLQRPSTQKSRLSPSGRFRIHYDTTTAHQPAMLLGDTSRILNSHEEYVDSVGGVLDHVWDQEITALGFGQPPSDGGVDGAEYDVYVQDMATLGLSGTFGYTDWTKENVPWYRSASFIVIENDFRGYRTPGLPGMRVTAAHEFHHAIQLGAYGVWNTVANSDLYFYELTAVWLEDVLYTDVDDYLFDLPRFFQQYKDAQSVSYPFTDFLGPRVGYERSVWAHFLARRFGPDIVRQIWEEVRARPVLRAHNMVLHRNGSSLASAFAEFSTWNFYTADRADTIRYYPEGRRYPRLFPNISVLHGGTSTSISTSAHPLSCQHYQFVLADDTVVAVVANTNFEGAYANAAARSNFTMTLGGTDVQGAYQRLANGLTVGFKGTDPDEWRTLYLSSTAKEDLKTNFQPFPNPVRLSSSDALHLPVDDPNATSAEVYFLSSTLDLALSGRYAVSDVFGTRMVSVPASEMRSNVSSGIHFVILRTTNQERRWKVAILR